MTAAARLLLTPGEPAGIGPELVVRLAQAPVPGAALIALADPAALQRAARHLGLPLHLRPWQPGTDSRELSSGELWNWSLPLAVPEQPGQLDRRNAAHVLEALRLACDACLAGSADALVTGPVHKGIINEAGVAFSGHTEFLAERSGAPLPVMLLAAGQLRVALVTTHLPLAAVPSAITAERLEQTLRVLHADLQSKFGLAEPRILVCGLNPHAGEGGHLGREEIEVIEPVLARLRAQGWRLEGPLPADTLFTPKVLARGDAVLAMYHDQGLPVLKHAGFGQAVNITLGLPIIRTSVDHGVALDLVGSGQADLGSLRAAVELARNLAFKVRP
ncbi:MAG: 4-hydroxythreonine-4-phosphate dehydrogenase PdxA [Nevskiaceae bacterium]|nr:MAG: 4-hydroxythreonine-4-phosphate dehydrogenase PdxA [Nevskiaceae bacterium]TAM31443.1 MAG: 4-hydroxythreonine-4-phosphate dehydrogenase PdxA [Nevskiaceae bacterium]